MPPKIATKNVPAVVAKPAPVVSKKPKEVVKPKPITHDHVAAHQKAPVQVDENGNEVVDENGKLILVPFNELIAFYEKEFLKQVCVNRLYMDQQAAQRYVINPRTGEPFDSFVQTFQFKYNNFNSVKIGERTVSLTKFLTNEKFCNRVIAYYKSLGYNCEIYQTGFDKEKKRYSKVCVKVFF